MFQVMDDALNHRGGSLAVVPRLRLLLEAHSLCTDGHHSLNVDAVDANGRSTLHWAAQKGLVVDLLLECGASTRLQVPDTYSYLCTCVPHLFNFIINPLTTVKKNYVFDHWGNLVPQKLFSLFL